MKLLTYEGKNTVTTEFCSPRQVGKEKMLAPLFSIRFVTQ